MSFTDRAHDAHSLTVQRRTVTGTVLQMHNSSDINLDLTRSLFDSLSFPVRSKRDIRNTRVLNEN